MLVASSNTARRYLQTTKLPSSEYFSEGTPIKVSISNRFLPKTKKSKLPFLKIGSDLEELSPSLKEAGSRSSFPEKNLLPLHPNKTMQTKRQKKGILKEEFIRQKNIAYDNIISNSHCEPHFKVCPD